MVGRYEAPGRGVTHLVNHACEVIGLMPAACTAAVQSFGNVGSVSACPLARRYGMRVTRTCPDRAEA